MVEDVAKLLGGERGVSADGDRSGEQASDVGDAPFRAGAAANRELVGKADPAIEQERRQRGRRFVKVVPARGDPLRADFSAPGSLARRARGALQEHLRQVARNPRDGMGAFFWQATYVEHGDPDSAKARGCIARRLADAQRFPLLLASRV